MMRKIAATCVSGLLLASATIAYAQVDSFSGPLSPGNWMSTFHAVKAQAANALLAGGTAATASDTLKQQFAEAMMIQAIILEVSLEQAKGHPDQLEALSQAANQGASGMGLDMRRMRLTPNGFAAR